MNTSAGAGRASGRRVNLNSDYRPLRERVRDEIRERIINGDYAPGARIIEREIADELGVSRIPIRESLRMLEIEGFVAVLPRKGVVVKQLSESDVVKLFEVREALEVCATRLAASNASDADITRLRKLLERAEQADAKGAVDKVQQANVGFHDELIKICGNEILGGLLEPLQGRLHWLFRQHAHPGDLVAEHRALLEAVASRDPERATEAAMAHVQTNRERALKWLFHTEEKAEEA
ncbi:GntR family transcriptional regulator [Kribbella sp. NPDC059898]|uniref:GntR family transcriptional regulator n=1 Tax=Kribbella sp. NPDC059898 TaxID=3346995 RepID=UPI003647EEAB